MAGEVPSLSPWGREFGRRGRAEAFQGRGQLAYPLLWIMSSAQLHCCAQGDRMRGGWWAGSNDPRAVIRMRDGLDSSTAKAKEIH